MGNFFQVVGRSEGLPADPVLRLTSNILSSENYISNEIWRVKNESDNLVRSGFKASDQAQGPRFI